MLPFSTGRIVEIDRNEIPVKATKKYQEMMRNQKMQLAVDLKGKSW